MKIAGILGGSALAVTWCAATHAQTAVAKPAAVTPPAIAASAPALRTIFEDNRKALNIPGTVYGVVEGGKLVLVEALGFRDPQTRAAVTADTRFRIASMSKAFTALTIFHLRDAGKISLDAPASTYVPELAGWTLPSGDSRAITVRDLLHHTAGLVEDNPWGDRQQVLSEGEFTALMKGGMAFATAPGTRMEYSNYGYALLGRIITNVTGQPYQQYIAATIFKPLGMTATGYDVFASPKGSRALGYRWQDGAWLREPDMRDGAFGSMGGVETTANDYAKWIGFLLSAWPPRGGDEAAPVRRSSVRDMVNLASPQPGRDRSPELGAPCRQSVAYGGGLNVVDDCDLGRVLTHSGGYPGYGSNMMLLPDAGVGLFVFNNRTYAGSGIAQFKAALALRRAGAVPDRPQPVSVGLAQAYAQAKAVWQSGDPAAATLANNVAMDRDLALRVKDIAAVKAKAGTCTLSEPIKPVSAAEGTFSWACSGGTVLGRVQRAPTTALQLQVVDFRLAPAS